MAFRTPSSRSAARRGAPRSALAALILAAWSWTACSSAAAAKPPPAILPPPGAAAPATAEESRFAADHPVWRVSGDPGWRPYSFRAADGRLVGLDLELSRQLGERIGVRLEWVDLPSWAEALRRFQAGEVDLLMGTAVTAERERIMLFTQPYAASPVAVIARRDAPFLVTLHDLAGQTIAVPEGHVTTEHLRKLHADLQLLVTPDLDAALRAVEEGRADAMVAGLIPAATSVRALGLDDLKVAGLVDMRFDLRVAVRPDWPVARTLLDRAIDADPPEVRMERFDRWLGPVMGLQRQALRWRRLFGVGLAVAGLAALLAVGVVAWNRTLKARVAAATRTLRVEMAAHQESEARFRTLFERAPIGMYRSTPGGAFLSVNPFLARLFEYGTPERMVADVNQGGIAGTLFDDRAQRPAIVAAVLDRPEGMVVSQVRYRLHSGRTIEALLSMNAVDDPVTGERTLLGFVQDVTERVRDEATSRQREKLMALGQMASGVAHDFNNMLAVVFNEAGLLAGRQGAEPAVIDGANHILEAAEGAHGLIRRLLGFVRARGGEEAVAYDAGEAVRVALELFRTAAGRRLQLEASLEATGRTVVGVRADLQNAVLNLCLNARDAMGDGGTLRVRTRDAVLTAADCEARAPYRPAPGPHLVIEVADTGAGMTPEVLASCCQPFFTTKGDGGTGLGLWTVHCLAGTLHGALRVESQVGVGTTVTLELPLAGGAPPPGA